MGTFVLIDDKRLIPTPGKKIIKASDYAAWLDANQLISATLEETDRIHDRAQEEAEAIRQKAYKEGLARGRAAMARQMLEVISQTSTYLQEFEDRIVATVLLSVRKIIGELPDSERMARMVSQALGVVRRQQRVIIRVAPAQEQEVAAQVKALAAPWPSIRHLDVVPDINLNPGTCVLESDLGLVEASVDGQLKVLESVLSQAFGRREEAVTNQMERMRQQVEASATMVRKEGVA